MGIASWAAGVVERAHEHARTEGLTLLEGDELTLTVRNVSVMLRFDGEKLEVVAGDGSAIEGATIHTLVDFRERPDQ